MRILTLLAGSLAAAVVVAGCSGGTPSGNTSSVAPNSTAATHSPAVSSPRPKPTSPYPAGVPLTGHNVRPGEKPPLYPAAAQARTQDGANAFAEFFMHTLDWAYATTNPSYLRRYTGATCGLCKGLATGIAKTAALHEWYLGGRLTVHPAVATRIAPVTAPADFCSVVGVDITAESVVDRTGKVFNGEGAQTNQRWKLCEKFSSGRWAVTYFAGIS